MKVFAAFIVILCIISIKGSSLYKILRHGNNVGNRHASSKNDRFDIPIYDAENKNEQRYYGFKTVENFPYKQNMSKSFFDMFSSSDDDSSPGEAEESSEEYFNPNAMYIGTYNDINNTYSDIDGPDSSEANFVINPLSDEVLASTPATKFHTNIFVPSLRSSVADVTRYCKESCSRATKRPCHKPFCIQKSHSTLWTTCESDCLSFFILFRGFLNELQM